MTQLPGNDRDTICVIFADFVASVPEVLRRFLGQPPLQSELVFLFQAAISLRPAVIGGTVTKFDVGTARLS